MATSLERRLRKLTAVYGLARPFKYLLTVDWEEMGRMSPAEQDSYLARESERQRVNARFIILAPPQMSIAEWCGRYGEIIEVNASK